VSAARKAGILDEVAEVLCFINERRPSPDLCSCAYHKALVDVFTKAFDDHICLARITIEAFYGEGFDIGVFSAAEVAPYLAEQSSQQT
jgi:hypothetical protein